MILPADRYLRGPVAGSTKNKSEAAEQNHYIGSCGNARESSLWPRIGLVEHLRALRRFCFVDDIVENDHQSIPRPYEISRPAGHEEN